MLIYGFLLLLLYLQTFLLAIVLSVRRWFTASYFSSCIFKLFFWLLSCLSVVDLRFLTSPLVSSNFSFGYCPVCPLLIYGFLLLLLYLQTFLLAIALSVLCWFTVSYFSSCIFKLFFWLLSCLSFVDLRLLTSPLVSSNFSFGYCPVCPLLIYGFLLLLLYLQTFLFAIVLSVLADLRIFYFSYYILKLFFWLLSCLSFVDLRLLTSPLVSSNLSFGYSPICPSLIYGFLLLLLYLQTFLLAIVLSVRRWFTVSYFSSCIFKLFFWLLSCLSFIDLRLLTSPLISSNFSFGYCPVCSLLIYGFLLLLLYLQTFLLAIVLSVLCWFTASYFSSCIFKLFFWLLSCLSFIDLWILTSPLVSSNFSFCYCPVCPSLIYGFFTSPLVSSNFSFSYCPVCPLLIYGFLLLLLYLQTFLLAIVLSVRLWFTDSYFSSFIFKLFFWLLSCLSFVDLRILASTLVSSNFSFGYSPVCPSLIYGFLLLLLCLQTFRLAIVLYGRRWFTDSYFSSCIFKLFFWR